MNHEKQKIAVVTGGSDGIGFGISQALAKQGAMVYLLARNAEKLALAKQRIQDDHGSADAIQADITKFETVKYAIDEITKRHGGIDIFVNNAGGYTPITLRSSWNDDIARIIDLDFRAPAQITQYVVQSHLDTCPQRPLHILSVLSQAALFCMPNGIGYGTAKKALASYLLELEHQLTVENITTVTLSRLYPGTTATPGVIDLVRQGILENPTSLDSVVITATDLIAGKAPTKDVYVGFKPGKGIVQEHYRVDPGSYNLLNAPSGTRILDSEFDPKTLL